MRIGILSTDFKDYHNSVKKYYGNLNLHRGVKNIYYFMDLRICPLISEKDGEKKYDEIVLSEEIKKRIDLYIKAGGNINVSRS